MYLWLLETVSGPLLLPIELSWKFIWITYAPKL